MCAFNTHSQYSAIYLKNLVDRKSRNSLLSRWFHNFSKWEFPTTSGNCSSTPSFCWSKERAHTTYTYKKEREEILGIGGLCKIIWNPALPPKSPRSGVTFHFNTPFPPTIKNWQIVVRYQRLKSNDFSFL